MNQREWLYAISDLNTEGNIGGFSDARFKNYVKSLNAFIDGFPAQATTLRSAIDAKMPGSIVGILAGIEKTLSSLYAEDLAKECRQLKSKFDGGDYSKIDLDEIEPLLERFLSAVSALSIDVQMAMHKARTSPPVTAQAQAPKAPSAVSPGRRGNILAVDNAVMFLSTLERLLKDHPYSLHCTTSCKDALQFLENNRPDVILLDIEMPEMDGYQLARQIRKAGHRAPIIFITAHSDREYVDKAIAEGAAGLLVKPLRINQLLAKLKENV